MFLMMMMMMMMMMMVVMQCSRRPVFPEQHEDVEFRSPVFCY